MNANDREILIDYLLGRLNGVNARALDQLVSQNPELTQVIELLKEERSKFSHLSNNATLEKVFRRRLEELDQGSSKKSSSPRRQLNTKRFEYIPKRVETPRRELNQGLLIKRAAVTSNGSSSRLPNWRASLVVKRQLANPNLNLVTTPRALCSNCASSHPSRYLQQLENTLYIEIAPSDFRSCSFSVDGTRSFWERVRLSVNSSDTTSLTRRADDEFWTLESDNLAALIQSSKLVGIRPRSIDASSWLLVPSADAVPIVFETIYFNKQLEENTESAASQSIAVAPEVRNYGAALSSNIELFLEALGREPTPLELDEYYWEDLVDNSENLEVSLSKQGGFAKIIYIATEPIALVGRVAIKIGSALIPHNALEGTIKPKGSVSKRKQTFGQRMVDTLIPALVGILIAINIVIPAFYFGAKFVAKRFVSRAVVKIGHNISIDPSKGVDVFPLISEEYLFQKRESSMENTGILSASPDSSLPSKSILEQTDPLLMTEADR